MPLFFAPLAAVALGIARGAIGDLTALARTRKTPYRSSRTLAERDVVQSMVARAEAATRSARAFLVESLEGLAAGATALFLDHPLQRRHRDIHALNAHVVMAFPGLETVGRVLLGLEFDTPLL